MELKAYQYTIRSIPASVDRALRRKARERGKSLNAVVLSALADAAGVGMSPVTYDDLDHLIGSWVEDPTVDRALRQQRRVDPGDWK